MKEDNCKMSDIKNSKKKMKLNQLCNVCKKKNLNQPCDCPTEYYKELTQKQQHKLKLGEQARLIWSKKIKNENLILKTQKFNSDICNNTFKEIAIIELDLCLNRQTTLKVNIINKKLWDTKKEFIYIITMNDYILKIGGTRDGMKGRWSSYCCGYYVSQRKKKNGENYPGKMSVTNAYLYHTIENNLIHNKNNIWKFYVWDIPISSHKVKILGEETTVISQTFHAYESICINKYKNIVGRIPLLCGNCDPNYK